MKYEMKTKQKEELKKKKTLKADTSGPMSPAQPVIMFLHPSYFLRGVRTVFLFVL